MNKSDNLINDYLCSSKSSGGGVNNKGTRPDGVGRGGGVSSLSKEWPLNWHLEGKRDGIWVEESF